MQKYNYPRILTIQDISCFGQCSLTVALPIISACGIETCVLPSSVLSTHTSGFSGYTFRDLTDDMPAILDHWKKEKIFFDAIYTGYLGSERQIRYVLDIAADTLKKDGLLIVDPAMADNGSLYPGFDAEFVNNMKELCRKADFILPNLTEACLLTGIPYTTHYTESYVQELLSHLKDICPNTTILTGASYDTDTTGVIVYNNNHSEYYRHERLPVGCHGTGDVYSSVFVGALLRGATVYDAAKTAADFVVACIKATANDDAHKYGVKFEPLLPLLIDKLSLADK